MDISIIAAVSANGVIGSNQDMPWHISEDLKRFKRLTLNSAVVMGRKTWESLPFKPLKNRTNIVISRNGNYPAKGAVVVSSLQAALEEAKGEAQIFVIGGGEIYQQALPLADKLYITEVHAHFEGDTFFPTIDDRTWQETERQKCSGEGNNPDYSFVSYQRKTKP